MSKKIYIGDQIINSGGGDGITSAQLDASLKEYTYDKAHIDASAKNINLRLSSQGNSIDNLVEGYNELYGLIGGLDSSVVYLDASALAFDASIRELAQSGGGSGGGSGFDPTNINASISDISTRVRTIENDYVIVDDISTFKPITYTSKDEYDANVSEGTIDPDTMYVITDLASSDELSNIVTIDDLNAEKARINASLNESGDEVITTANSSMNYWKTQNVSQCQSQCNSAKNSAVSAVQSQQTTSVNAVNSAKNTAISEIDTKMAEMKSFEVMTEAEYAEITPDSNTIYFITD